MPRKPPDPGYVRPRKFGGWPEKYFPLPDPKIYDREMCDRFFVALQTVIIREIMINGHIRLNEVGLFERHPNNHTQFRNPYDNLPAVKKNTWSLTFYLAQSQRFL